MISFLQMIDNAMRQMIFNRYSSIMEFSTLETDVHIIPKGHALRTNAETRGDDDLEFSNIWRSSVRRDLKRAQTPIARRGLNISYTDVFKTDILSVKGVPCFLDYDVWIWSRDLDKLTKVDEEYLFTPNKNATVSIQFKIEEDGQEISVGSPMDMFTYIGDVHDESPIEDMNENGLYFVHKYTFSLEAWVLQTITSKTVKTIIIEIYDDLGDEPTLLLRKEITCEDSSES